MLSDNAFQLLHLGDLGTLAGVRFEPDSIEECNQAFERLGLKLEGVQLEPTRKIRPVFAAAQVGECLVTSFSFQSRVHFRGSPRPGYIPFAVMVSGDSWYHGYESFGNDICGIRSNRRKTTDTHWVGEMAVIFVPEQLFMFKLQQNGMQVALDRLAGRANRVALPPRARRDFLRMHRKALHGELMHEEQWMDMLALSLNQPLEGRASGMDAEDYRVISAMINACRTAANLRKPLSLTQMLTLPGIDVAKTKLNSLCQKHMHGLTGAQYMKQCRMACVNASLVRGEFETVEEARAAHRFNGKGDFFSDYYKQFGEMPLTTLRRYQNYVS